jgi:hypothetical protein
MRARLRCYGKVAAAALLAVSGATVIALARRGGHDPEPTYRGRSLTQWCTGPLLWSGPFRYEELEAQALYAMGTNAQRFLVKWASYEPSAWHKSLDPIVQKVPVLRDSGLVARLFYKKSGRAAASVGAFALLREDGAAALPELVQIAANTNRPVAAKCARNCIAEILGGGPYCFYQPQGTALLTNALSDTSPILREEATNVLAHLVAAQSRREKRSYISKRPRAVTDVDEFGNAGTPRER